MFNTDPLTRDPRPEDIQRLNTARASGDLGGDKDSKGTTLGAALVLLVLAVGAWFAGWVFPFQTRLPELVALVIAFVLPLLALFVLIGGLWQAIPELLRGRSSKRPWMRVAVFAEYNGLQYRANETDVPRSALMRSDYISEEDIVRAPAGPFGEAGMHTWSFPKPDGKDDFATSHYIYFRLPFTQPYAFVRRNGATRNYEKPMQHTMEGYPPAPLALPLQGRYVGVALAGFDPRVWDVLTNQMLTTVEALGGDCDVEICDQGVWLHSDQAFDLRDPRFWRAVDILISNVLAQLPGANLGVAPIPLPPADLPDGPATASLKPDPKAPDDSGISCGGIIAVSVALQLAGLLLHVFAHWPMR